MDNPFDDSPFEDSANQWRIPEGETPHEKTVRMPVIGSALMTRNC